MLCFKGKRASEGVPLEALERLFMDERKSLMGEREIDLEGERERDFVCERLFLPDSAAVLGLMGGRAVGPKAAAAVGEVDILGPLLR